MAVVRRKAFARPSLAGALALSLFLLTITRLLTLGLYPLFDQTEARYAEIARMMAETGDWIVPQVDYGVPFWAKPPLSIWFSAISIYFFGVNEFAARFPSFILSIAVAGLTFIVRQDDYRLALTSVVVLSSSVLFFIAAGAVMTDMSLAFCTTLSMVAFYRAVQEQQRFWGYVFFCALGLGMLAKGPIAIVLVGLPTAAWTFWMHRWAGVWKRLPWISGTILSSAISVPWYIVAELHSPGFLSYFVFVEHLKRFAATGEIADLYGHQSIQFYGMIWIYWLGSLMPWSGILLGAAIRRYWRGETLTIIGFRNDRQRYLLCWALAPAIFFTFTRDILWTYVLPALPACAILIAETLHSPGNGVHRLQGPKEVVAAALISPVLMMGFAAAFTLGVIAPPSGKLLRYQVSKLEGWKPGALTYVASRPYSGQFYELGRAPKVSLANVAAAIKNGQVKFLAVPRNVHLQEEMGSQLALVGGDAHYQLFRIVSEQK